jgi:hypothetical protein
MASDWAAALQGQAACTANARMESAMGRYRILSLPALVLSALGGVFVGAGGCTAYYGEGASYLSNNPRACVNCHIMRDHYDGWDTSSHHAVATCNDCHAPHAPGEYARILGEAIDFARQGQLSAVQMQP